jgi:hypothetical protein
MDDLLHSPLKIWVPYMYICACYRSKIGLLTELIMISITNSLDSIILVVVNYGTEGVVVFFL